MEVGLPHLLRELHSYGGSIKSRGISSCGVLGAQISRQVLAAGCVSREDEDESRS